MNTLMDNILETTVALLAVSAYIGRLFWYNENPFTATFWPLVFIGGFYVLKRIALQLNLSAKNRTVEGLIPADEP